MKMLGALAKVQQDAAKESAKDTGAGRNDPEGDKIKPADQGAQAPDDKEGGPPS
jgi:hypothetical protein